MNSEDEATRAFGGRYRLLEFVGEGSNARVYVAEDLTLRRTVSLKILRADLGDDDAFGERFASEMRATAALRHPRVLPVYDWGMEPQPFTVTEHLTGGSLAEVIGAGHRLTPSQALVVGLEAARGIANVHASGRAHLGLSPASILFDSGARPYISDLGLAAALNAVGESLDDSEDASDADRVAPDDTGDAASGDRHSYSAAEQAQDVGDLALILNEAVTGTTSLPHSDHEADLVPVTVLGPLLSVLERAAAVDHTERLTARELASELLRVASLLPRPDPLPLAIHEAPPSPTDIAIGATGTLEPVGPSVSQRAAVAHDDVPRRRWPGLLLAVVLVAAGAFFGIRAWLSGAVGSADVPDLVGETRAAAASAAADHRWELNEILVREPDTRRGEVLRTEPAAGASLSEGETLDVLVSLGEPLVVLADLDGLYGLTVEDATGQLEAAGLGVGAVTLVNDEEVPAGNLVGLDVGGGVYELEVGEEVGLVVSDGPADRTVPAVPESRDLIETVDRLNSLNLAHRRVLEHSDDVPAGAVIGFRPASGSSVPVGTTVTVQISHGPAPVPSEPADAEAVEGDTEAADSGTSDAS